MKPLAIKSGFRYLIYGADGALLGHVYYPHTKKDTKDRKELDAIMNELFEVKEL